MTLSFYDDKKLFMVVGSIKDVPTGTDPRAMSTLKEIMNKVHRRLSPFPEFAYDMLIDLLDEARIRGLVCYDKGNRVYFLTRHGVLWRDSYIKMLRMTPKERMKVSTDLYAERKIAEAIRKAIRSKMGWVRYPNYQQYAYP